MKKIFNNFLLVFLSPFRLLKKTKIDNFVGGLIFGAIFSLIVNVATVRIQEDVQKQRILEALESEILTNTLQAINVVSENTKDLENNNPYNPFASVRKYSKDLWAQSSEPLQYVAQLEQDEQIAVIDYYTIVIPGQNELLDNMDKITYQKLINCSSVDNPEALTDKNCIAWNRLRLNLENDSAKIVSEEGFKINKLFHPTQDRLNNWFLRLILGGKSMRILSGE